MNEEEVVDSIKNQIELFQLVVEFQCSQAHSDKEKIAFACSLLGFTAQEAGLSYESFCDLLDKQKEHWQLVNEMRGVKNES